MKRALSLLVAAASVLGMLTGCATKLDYRPQVQAIIRHTEALARTYTYKMSSGGHTSTVNVEIADDFRYLATYARDGSPEVDEIVRDDARAVQVHDPALLASIKTGGQTTAPTTAAGTVKPLDATVPVGGFVAGKTAVSPATVASLQKGQWVEDSSGSYTILRPASLSRPPTPGADQVGDALKVLADLDTYISGLPDGAVVPFNPEAGYYFKALDPFPRPAAGTQRYDVSLSPQLPGRSAVDDSPGQRQAAIPLADYFLSAAVYVRNGVVVSIRESANVALRLRLPDQDIVARLQDALVKLPAGISSLSPERQAPIIDQALNKFYAQHQDPALVQRYVVVDFSQLGVQTSITLPASPVQASLAGIFDRGQTLGGGS